ncbi:MAG: XisI protein [Arcicella sp.]|nr:XisI protein [Arcicella sp.]
MKYQQILCEVLQEYGEIEKKLTPGVKRQVIIDKERKHYQLLSVGWHNKKFVYNVAFHFDIMEGKIWIQQNSTDVLIADELIERGVLKSDIVLGFIPENVRNYEGFAVA